jgi:hypothetical protein
MKARSAAHGRLSRQNARAQRNPPQMALTFRVVSGPCQGPWPLPLGNFLGEFSPNSC